MSVLTWMFAFLLSFCVGRAIGRFFQKGQRRRSMTDRHPPWEIAVGIWALVGLIIYLFDLGATS